MWRNTSFPPTEDSRMLVLWKWGPTIQGLAVVKGDSVFHPRSLPVLKSSEPFCLQGRFYPGLPLFIPHPPRTILQDCSQIFLEIPHGSSKHPKGHLGLCPRHSVAAQLVSLPTRFSCCPGGRLSASHRAGTCPLCRPNARSAGSLAPGPFIGGGVSFRAGRSEST